MKSIKGKVMTTAALAATLFSVGSVPALAADGGEYDSTGTITFEPYTGITKPVDPENPGDIVIPTNPDGSTPEEGTSGPLSIDFASSFDFGTNTISSQTQTYDAFAQKITKNGVASTVPNYVQITDSRGTEAGWTLTVTQDTEFTSTTDSTRTLEGSTIVISNIESVTASESPSPTDVTAEITLDGATSTDVVMAAKDGEGAGTHLANFGNDTTKATSVTLEVPGSIVKYADTYETTLIWTLNDTPAN